MSDVRRDRWQRYLALPPQGGKLVGYTRATTVAKTLDDGGGLIPWRATATVVGAMRRPGLHAQWQELISRSPNPWYDSPQSKAECKRLVEECATAGGSSDRAEQGTALHAMIAAGVDVDGLTILQPSTRADIIAYRSMLAAAGVVIDPTMVERMVVLDYLQIAGTADNLRVTMPDYGELVADLKTGADLTYSWQSIAVQLAIYAHGDNTYEQGEAADGSQDVRGVMPDVSKEYALVIHLPAGEARCVLYIVDIAAGWEAVEHSMWARRWRTRKGIATALAIEATPPHGAGVVSGGAAGAVTATQNNPSASVSAPAAPPPFDEPVPFAAATELRTSAASEFVAIKPHEHEFIDNRCACGATVGAYGRIIAADATLSVAAAAVVDSFGPIVDDTPAAFIHLPIDDGDEASDLALDALKVTYDKVVGPSRSWVNRIGKEAKAAGCSFHLTERRSLRRFEILRALTAYARANESDFDESNADEIIRAIAFSVVADARIESSWTVGGAVGHLDAARAALFAQRVHEFITRPVPGTTDGPRGHLRLHFAA